MHVWNTSSLNLVKLDPTFGSRFVDIVSTLSQCYPVSVQIWVISAPSDHSDRQFQKTMALTIFNLDQRVMSVLNSSSLKLFKMDPTFVSIFIHNSSILSQTFPVIVQMRVIQPHRTSQITSYRSPWLPLLSMQSQE